MSICSLRCLSLSGEMGFFAFQNASFCISAVRLSIAPRLSSASKLLGMKSLSASPAMFLLFAS